MSSSNDLSEMEASRRLKMKPAVRSILCCSVNAASGFVAAYTLVAYAVALIYEIVWVVESQHGLPVGAMLLMVCYCIVIAATIALLHGLISKNNKFLMAWLIAVILVLIPECALVFYMSISHWGLQGVYGGAELACYVARLPGIVLGVVFVQSAYAIREARKVGYNNGMVVPGSEFDASHYVPEAPSAFINDGFTTDNGKPGSMPDLRRHLATRHSINCGHPPIMLPPPPPAYWQHIAERQYAASLRGFPKPYHGAQLYGTWVGPRTSHENPYKRRHSVVGTFDAYPQKDYEIYGEDRTDCKSETGYYRYNPYGNMYPHDNERYYDYKRNDPSYGGNLLRHDPYHFNAARERMYYEQGLRNSHTSVGAESDDLGKYKDVAL